MDRSIPIKLEQLVDGELGLAVLNGFWVLGWLAMRDVIERGPPERFKELVYEARREAALLACPRELPAEARAEWRRTALEAVDYASIYMPDFLEPGGGEPE
ncbi:MAG: hypothetical protein P4M09_17065 [Devosia sp.]|nr:hypothetical protein [Devosia sp.]